MTESDWSKLKEELTLFSLQKLRIDGYNITLMLAQHKMRLVIMVYVNGYIKGKWMTKESNSPIKNKFFWERSSYLYSKNEQRKLVKIYGSKKRAVEAGVFKKHTYYSPYFYSFSTLKKTFKARNESIEWVQNTKHETDNI